MHVIVDGVGHVYCPGIGWNSFIEKENYFASYGDALNYMIDKMPLKDQTHNMWIEEDEEV